MIVVDKERTREVLGRLHQAYIQKLYPFNQPEAVPPQIKKNIPPVLVWGSREHALFLFALCYWMRGGIKSHTATHHLTKIYNAHPDIFLPEQVDRLSQEMLINILGKTGLNFNVRDTSNGWLKNARRLRDMWGSDPRTLFSGIDTYEAACDRIQNRSKTGFHGFQEKMVSMITYFFMHAGMVDQWNFPIPVDFHVLRTVFSHQIIRATQTEGRGNNGFYTKRILAQTRQIFLDYCEEHGVSPIELCDAVWLYSGLMCNQYPGNQSRGGRERRGRKTEIRPMPRWSKGQMKTYERTCAVCIVAKSCTWAIPAGPYYIGGRIDLREKHESPPQGILSLLPPPRSLRPFQKEKVGMKVAPEENVPFQESLFPLF
ncbi:MAG: hypothetical protein AAB903_03645 [Patescibacteria group bacterium]